MSDVGDAHVRLLLLKPVLLRVDFFSFALALIKNLIFRTASRSLR